MSQIEMLVKLITFYYCAVMEFVLQLRGVR